jgi:hypothetical protein
MRPRSSRFRRASPIRPRAFPRSPASSARRRSWSVFVWSPATHAVSRSTVDVEAVLLDRAAERCAEVTLAMPPQRALREPNHPRGRRRRSRSARFPRPRQARTRPDDPPVAIHADSEAARAPGPGHREGSSAPPITSQTNFSVKRRGRLGRQTPLLAGFVRQPLERRSRFGVGTSRAPGKVLRV